MNVELVHSVPGRVRLRLSGLPRAAAELWRSLEQWAAAQPHVHGQRVNPACFCIIINYDASAPDTATQIIARLQTLSRTELPEPVPVAQVSRPVPQFLNTLALSIRL